MSTASVTELNHWDEDPVQRQGDPAAPKGSAGSALPTPADFPSPLPR